jgi:hypothetical protein
MKSLTTAPNGTQPVKLPEFYLCEVTPGLPARQVSIGAGTVENPNWHRSIQISDEFVFVKRGKLAVAVSIADVINLAMAVEPGLTWSPPKIMKQPESVEAIAPTRATFKVQASSEYNIGYQWQESQDGKTWQEISDESAKTETLTVQCSAAGQKFIRCLVYDDAETVGEAITEVVHLTIII